MLADKVKIRIEADKAERKFKQARERERERKGLPNPAPEKRATSEVSYTAGSAAEEPKLTEAQKNALEIAKERKANKEQADRTRLRIEADKVERKIKQARERERRLAAEEAARAAKEAVAPALKEEEEPANMLFIPPPPEVFQGVDPTERSTPSSPETRSPPKRQKRNKRQAPGRLASEGQAWQGDRPARGQMTEAQMRALGLLEDETMKDEEE